MAKPGRYELRATRLAPKPMFAFMVKMAARSHQRGEGSEERGIGRKRAAEMDPIKANANNKGFRWAPDMGLRGWDTIWYREWYLSRQCRPWK